MLSLTFGAPALKGLAVLDFLSMRYSCYFWKWLGCARWGEIVVVDTEGVLHLESITWPIYKIVVEG
jgi:hypothetical protein